MTEERLVDIAVHNLSPAHAKELLELVEEMEGEQIMDVQSADPNNPVPQPHADPTLAKAGDGSEQAETPAEQASEVVEEPAPAEVPEVPAPVEPAAPEATPLVEEPVAPVADPTPAPAAEPDQSASSADTPTEAVNPTSRIS